MACNARVSVPAMIDDCSNLLDGLDSLVDVGGGNGTTLRVLIKACPWIRGINFDLPHVVSEAADFVGDENVGGDMFESVPKADAAILKIWLLQRILTVAVAVAVVGGSAKNFRALSTGGDHRFTSLSPTDRFHHCLHTFFTSKNMAAA
ncbi:3'-hydroxy-N-methyl-(S)-coclaurine 4'-O-methyltransferase 2 [Camellia lanceoleosa]|uniref:3'-hydroxy-N-methyl-(S)-coclaurine 4'-O-methyltransferase 2 n=1 Tax=Camellia lanceoleosa TaxID=1840588 RepID=A0ACC0IDY3_9ERIC|nr:3'-hydroxy-N-methyl-(S)-coclaurine 4'-O-methyltransferase 2 [Camellia lanceoleosa]